MKLSYHGSHPAKANATLKMCVLKTYMLLNLHIGSNKVYLGFSGVA